MKKILIISSIVIVSLVALGIAGFAYAQAQPPTPTPQTSSGNQIYQNFPFPGLFRGWLGILRGFPQGMPGIKNIPAAGMMGYRMGLRQGLGRGFTQGMFGPIHDYMLQALAPKLGLSVAELQAKIDAGEWPWNIAKANGLTDQQVQELMKQVQDEALQAAVKAGVITQAQADAMDKWMEPMWQENSTGWMLGSVRGPGLGLTQKGPLYPYKLQAFASAVGLSTEQVQAQLDAGKSPLQIAQDQGLTVEQFRTKLIDSAKAAVNQALADGKITKEQADWLLGWLNWRAIGAPVTPVP